MMPLLPLIKPELLPQTMLNRMAAERPNAAWIAAQRASPEARTYMLIDLNFVIFPGTASQVRLRPFSTKDLTAAGISTDDSCFLGLTDEGAPCFSLALSASRAATLPGGVEALGPLGDLFALAWQGGALPPHELAIAGQARKLAVFHANHRCCGRCGAPTEPADGGWRRDCSACGHQHFPRADPAVIMVITYEGRMLLGRENRWPEKFFSIPAGFVEPGDDIETAVRREIMEETGLPVGRVNYLASQPWPFPHSLMIGCWGQALSGEIRLDERELREARWADREEMSAMLAGRHPLGHSTARPFTIAHTLIRAYADGTLG